MNATDKQKAYQASWRERNRDKAKAYFKKRREEVKIRNVKNPILKSDETFYIKLENPKEWEKRYREAFEKAYGKIEK